MPDSRKKYSLATIAGELGVSKSAVSFVLNGTAREHRISRKLESRIRTFCTQVNYLPNIHAQRMNSKLVKNIGILLTRDCAPYGNTPFNDYNVANIVGGIAEAASEAGYRFSCQIYSPSMKEETIFDWFRNKEIGGLIYYGTCMPPEWGPFFRRENFRTVGISIDPACGVPCVNVDNFGAAFELTARLIRQGRKKFIFLDGTGHAYPGLERYRGFRAALRSADIPFRKENRLPADFDRERAFEVLESLFRRRKRLDMDAIVCANDYMAVGAIQFLQKHGIRIPEEIAVTGADNTNWCEIVSPSLTSFDYRCFDLGKAAFSLLKKIMTGGKAENLVLETTLDLRQSG